MRKIFLLILLSLTTLVGCNNKETTEYRADLQSVADKMLENVAEAEVLLEQYSNIWRYSIESKGAIPVQEIVALTGLEEEVVREYFEINAAGNIPKDFSINIHSMNSYYDATGALGELKETSNEIKNKMSTLNEPPLEYEKVYDEVLDMYTRSEEYIEMALSPKGSLESFNEDKNQLSSDILSKHKRIEATMPNEE